MLRSTHHDAEAIVLALPANYGGRSNPLFDGYRGQFHLPDEPSDWDAEYTFESEKLRPGEESKCDIWFSPSLKKHAHEKLSIGYVFHIREGARTVAIGRIITLPLGLCAE